MSAPTRAEHLQWCKDRAQSELDYYPDVREACRNAMMSLASDLGKHPETEDHPAIQLGVMMLMGNQAEASDKDAMRKFILGTN